MEHNHQRMIPKGKLISYLYDFAITLSLLALATLFSFFFVKYTQSSNNVAICYILAIVLISRFTNGYFYGMISSVVGVFGINYIFTYPYLSIDFTRSGYPLSFLGMFAITVITSTTTAHVKEHAKLTIEREEHTKRLNEICNKLLSANQLEHIIELTLDYARSFTGRTIIFYPSDPDVHTESSIVKASIKSVQEEDQKFLFSFHEKFIAHWVFEHGKPAGVGTEYCVKSACTYLPLISHEQVLGVIGICCLDGNQLTDNELTFLNLMISQVALSLERQHLSDNRQEMLIDTEKEKMRANLLRAVSHDLRTPLTGIIGATSTIMENRNQIPVETQDLMLKNIYEDASWLLHMVENLLSVTRIHEGTATVTKTAEPLEEVIAEAVMRVRKRYPNSQVSVTVPDELLIVPMDATLIEQVVINLIENALKYAKSKRPIDLVVSRSNDEAVVKIRDYGIGLQEDQLKNIFDGTTRTNNKSSDSAKGMGIGLSICKTIIFAHGGNITAQNHPDGGAVFAFTLKISEQS